MDSPPLRLGVLGAGNMANALIRGAIDQGVVRAGDVIASRRNTTRLAELEAELSIRVTTDNAALCSEVDVILLGIKPQGFAELMTSLKGTINTRQLIVSILAGITTRAIEDAAGVDVPVIRVMPNTPALVGRGMSPFCRGRFATDAHAGFVSALLGAVGRTLEVNEDQMDPVTATSGSGPAYLFYLAEAMQRGAEGVGLSAEVARTLVEQTILGAATQLVQSRDGASELRRRVTSKGGTTAAALGVLEHGGAADLFVEAIAAANRRAGELGGS